MKDISFKPSQKIGIKLLDPEQLKTLLPQSAELAERIKQQRERASEPRNPNIPQDEYYLMHDNIYGIFGGRGSGKTSILFTLRNELLKSPEGQSDIILPIIMPDLINGDCSLLGWVLAMLGDVVEKISMSVKQQPNRFDTPAFLDDCGINFFENCRFNEHNSLQAEYESIYKECFGETRDLSDQYSFGEATSIRAEQSKRQFKLTRKLNQFWDRLVKTKKAMANAALQNNRITPLIFIMFDDIDLAPERSIELLSASYRYFSNPNVVVYITAAFGTLRRVLQYKMYEKVVGSSHRSLIQGMELGKSGFENYPMAAPYKMTQAKISAIEYLNKIVPPSSRYFLETYQSCEHRKLFRYPGTYGDDIQTPASQPLEEYLVARLKILCMTIEKSRKQSTPPRIFLENERGQFLTGYLAIFGEKSRYISNGCLMIMNTLEELGKIAEHTPVDSVVYEQQVFHALTRLLSVLISSSIREVAEYRGEVFQLLVLKQGGWRIYVDYGYLLKLYRLKRLEAEKSIAEQLNELSGFTEQDLFNDIHQEDVKNALWSVKRSIGILFSILFFIENLVALMFPERGAAHGFREMADYLNWDTLDLRKVSLKRMKLFRSYHSVEELMEKYWYVLDNPKAFIYLNPYDPLQLNTYFNQNSPDGIPSFRELSTALNEDYDWCKTWLSLLFMYNSGILLVNKDFNLKLQRLNEKLKSFSIGDYLEQFLQQNLFDFLQADELYVISAENMGQTLLYLNSHKHAATEQYDMLVQLSEDMDLESIFADPLTTDEKLLRYHGSQLWKKHLETIPRQNTAEGKEAAYKNFINFFEKIVELCEAALLVNDFEIHIEHSNLQYVSDDMETLMQLSDRVNEIGSPIYSYVNSCIRDKEQQNCVLAFSEYYRFLTALEEAQRSQIAESVYAITFSAKMHLMDNCPIYAFSGKEKQMVNFVLDLHLVHYLSRTYFSALFLLEERNHYRYSNLLDGSKDIQNNSKDYTLAMLYKEILGSKEKNNPLYNLLSEAKRDIVIDYANNLEAEHG